MEEDSEHILSPLLTKPLIKKQFERLEIIAKEAQKRVDYKTAHDPEIIKAITVVERFLRKSKRVCYGGQAINSLLPKERKFYDPNLSIPDYDFFSPEPEKDVEDLITDLKGEGFTDIYKKVGVHDGTTKLYVNFVPVADISEIVPGLFRIIHRRAKTVGGILYCDPDFLRMMMYLELSRPRGEVKRWTKVYERLLLLNDSYPVGQCSEDIRTPQVSLEDRATLLDYCIKHKNVVVSPECIELFEKGESHKNLYSLVKRGGPVMFFSASAKVDAEDIQSMLNQTENGGVRIESNKIPMDNIFNFVTVKRKGQPVALIFQEDACHSYTTLRLDEGDTMRIAMPDLYLHLYYTLMIFGKREKLYFETGIECLIQKLYSLVAKSRDHPTNFLPAFGLRCSGRQRGIATLLRQKQERASKKKEGGRRTVTLRRLSRGRKNRSRRLTQHL
jgi:hypothetical protein